MFNFAGIVEYISNFLYTYILIAILIALGLYFTIKSNFVQFRYIKEMLRLLGDSGSAEKEKGHVSS